MCYVAIDTCEAPLEKVASEDRRMKSEEWYDIIHSKDYSYLDLTNIESSDIKYKVMTFNDGEPHIELFLEGVKVKSLTIITRISNPADLFILQQVIDVLKRNKIKPVHLFITYLMGARNDRLFSIGRPVTRSIVVEQIEHICKDYVFNIHILCLHGYNGRYIEHTFHQEDRIFLDRVFKEKDVRNIILPDEGALGSLATDNYRVRERLLGYGEKKRDVNTGLILDYDLHIKDYVEDEADKPIYVVDDIIDGGMTFVILAERLRKEYPNRELNLIAFHAVNDKGLEKVCSIYDNVYVTNSHHEIEAKPINCEVYNVSELIIKSVID